MYSPAKEAIEIPLQTLPPNHHSPPPFEDRESYYSMHDDDTTDIHGHTLQDLESVKEPPPERTSSFYVKGFIKEKVGRMTGNKQLEKEGRALEKAAHPSKEWERAEEQMMKTQWTRHSCEARRPEF